jgi:hypothetical protein
MSPFAQFRPDLAETNAVSANVLNVVLRQDGQGVAYGPMPGIALTATATALPANPKGGVSLVNRNGDYFAFVGTSRTSTASTRIARGPRSAPATRSPRAISGR